MSDKLRRLKDKASRYYGDGKLKDALKAYLEILEREPGELSCQIKVGDIHRKLGNRSSAVEAYEPVARAYASDGMLLKAIAVCKLILNTDPRHTETQTMLAELYAKRRGPARTNPPLPPRRGDTPVPGSMAAAIELPPEPSAPMELTVGGKVVPADNPSAVPGRPSTDGAVPPPQWPPAPSGDTPDPQVGAWSGSAAPGTPNEQISGAWPVMGAPSAAPEPPKSDISASWPVSKPAPPSPPSEGESLEDSVLDITVDAVMSEAELIELQRRKAEQVRAREAAQSPPDLSAVDALEDEPIDIDADTDEPIPLTDEVSASTPVAPPSIHDQRIGDNPEQTWTGVIRLEDLDGPTPQQKGEVTAASPLVDAGAEKDAAAIDAESLVSGEFEVPPIELTKRKDDSQDIAPAVEEMVSLADLAGEESDELGRPQIPLFSDLPKNAFISLLVKMEMREMEKDEFVIKEGDSGDSFFVLASGKVRVVRNDPEGNEVLLAYLTDGAFFGEMALLQDGARTASVIVEEESQVFEISKMVLDEIVTSYPSVARVLRNFYKQRLLSTAMATHPLFKPFSIDERKHLMEMFKSRSFDQGAEIVKEGKKASGLYLLLYGTLNVVKKKQGEELHLAQLTSGDMFGEISLLTGAKTVASIVAETEAFVVRLSKRKFDEVIMTHPQVLELVSEISEARATVNDALLKDTETFNAEGAVLV